MSAAIDLSPTQLMTIERHPHKDGVAMVYLWNDGRFTTSFQLTPATASQLVCHLMDAFAEKKAAA